MLLAEALSADLKAHQRQLMTLAQEVLVGCEDTVWPVAAPTACAIVCALGELPVTIAWHCILHWEPYFNIVLFACDVRLPRRGGE